MQTQENSFLLVWTQFKPNTVLPVKQESLCKLAKGIPMPIYLLSNSGPYTPAVSDVELNLFLGEWNMNSPFPSLMHTHDVPSNVAITVLAGFIHHHMQQVKSARDAIM